MFCKSNCNTRHNKLSHAHPATSLSPKNVNSNSSSNDFSGIKPGHDNQGGRESSGKRNVLQFLCNFSSIDQKRAGWGLRGELIDLGAAFGTEGQSRQAHEGPERKIRGKE